MGNQFHNSAGFQIWPLIPVQEDDIKPDNLTVMKRLQELACCSINTRSMWLLLKPLTVLFTRICVQIKQKLKQANHSL